MSLVVETSMIDSRPTVRLQLRRTTRAGKLSPRFQPSKKLRSCGRNAASAESRCWAAAFPTAKGGRRPARSSLRLSTTGAHPHCLTGRDQRTGLHPLLTEKRLCPTCLHEQESLHLALKVRPSTTFIHDQGMNSQLGNRHRHHSQWTRLRSTCGRPNGLPISRRKRAAKARQNS